jgi:tRNA (guanine9-N1)-methyltransferase|tara:strand:- start:502 stop:1122 length:621 start_codon:yes stop_codon:yes gene_type:complete
MDKVEPHTTSAAPAAFQSRLSKADKRKLKIESLKERRQLWRQRTKEARRENVRLRGEQRATRLAAMSEQERKTFQLFDAAERSRLYNEKVAQTARFQAAHDHGLRVVLDLSYSSEMTDKEQRSLSRQLARCWGANRRAAAPVALHISSLGRCSACCLPENNDHLRWKVHLLEEDLVEHFAPEELVFLSPDADDVLERLDRDLVGMG